MDRSARLLLIGMSALMISLLASLQAWASPVTSAIDVLIDVGHGGIDGGTSYGNVLEKDINLAVAKKLRKKLSQRGFKVALTRSRDYALSEDNHWLSLRSRHKRDLAQRSLIARQINPKVLVSLHVNWSSKPNKRGAVVLYRPSSQPSFILANVLQHALNPVYGIHMPPFYSDRFYLLNTVSCPSVIIEMGFISNVIDRDMLTRESGQESIAEAISSALWEYLSLFNINESLSWIRLDDLFASG